MSYEVKIIADSISKHGHRLTTLQCTFPRFILAEVNTHRVMSRNSASSRAIPVKRRIEQIEKDPFVPIAFGKNQKGMQAGESLDGGMTELSRLVWLGASQIAVEHAKKLDEFGVHKQWANRVIETYAWHTAVITATEWENHDALRDNPQASPEYQTIARMMKEARAASKPRLLSWEGEWHLPYVLDAHGELSVEDANAADAYMKKVGMDPKKIMSVLRKVSVGRCASVSYERQEEKDFFKDVDRYGRLRTGGHMSCFEHPARPMNNHEYWDLFCQKKLEWDEEKQDWNWVGQREDGSGGEYWHFFGNVQGFVQDRKMIPNEHDFSKVVM